MALGSVVFLLVFAAVLLLVVKLHREDIMLETQRNLIAEGHKKSSLPQSEYDVWMTVQAAEAIAYRRYPRLHQDHRYPNPDDNPENVRV